MGHPAQPHHRDTQAGGPGNIAAGTRRHARDTTRILAIPRAHRHEQMGHYRQPCWGVGCLAARNNTLAVYVNPYEIAKFAARLDYEHAVAAAQKQPVIAAAAVPAAPPGS
jgi:hypothetical protein